MKIYRMADRISQKELYEIGATDRSKVKAVYSGQFRPPRKGEWFMSGSIVEAYKAKSDMTVSYHIARLVKVQMKEVIVT
tara:strand:- start:34938 stop:35174 length:237 start_codon:yes stop_codon:yes gene_type:complete